MSFELIDDVNRVSLDGEDVTEAIRQSVISGGASIVSALPGVRQALLEQQRHIASQGSVVVEGRDTGTVVFPQADAKFFVTADDEVRAERRHRELSAQGSEETLAEVMAALQERDERDSTRDIAPLVPAADARIVDTTERTAEEVIGEILSRLPAR